MPAYYLEALTITLGIILLLAEAFVSTKSKAWVGIAAALGLVVVLILTRAAIGPESAGPAAVLATMLKPMPRFQMTPPRMPMACKRALPLVK